MWYRCSHHKPNRSWGTFQKVLCNWFPLKAGLNWLRGWKYKDGKRLAARDVRWILNYEIKFGLFFAFICFVYEHSGFSKEEDVQNPSFFFLFCHFYHFYYDLQWFLLIARQRFRGFYIPVSLQSVPTWLLLCMLFVWYSYTLISWTLKITVICRLFSPFSRGDNIRLWS